MLLYHILGLLIGSVLDFIIGDPHGIPHPIIAIGKWIAFLDRKLLGENVDGRSKRSKKLRGVLLVFLVMGPTLIITGAIVIGAYLIHPVLGVAVEAILTCYTLAAKSLKKESALVVKKLNTEGLPAARKALSMIVGRDTMELDEEEVVKAAIETVAENTADGVMAPLICLAIGGPILGLVYKSVNTMDSMVGYKNDRYMDFGTAAARMDDVWGYIPARLTGLFIILSAAILPGFSGKEAWRIFKRDRYNHKSPNSAQSESAMAGALGLKLGGGAFYFGKWVEKPSMGDDLRPVERKDLARSHTIMYSCVIISELIAIIVLGLLWFF